MVVEVSEQEAVGQAAAKPRDRWNDAYANAPVRRMVALYDYDPQELSPNVDADVIILLNILFLIASIEYYHQSSTYILISLYLY